MARYTGPKNRLARRESVDLGMKTVGSHAHAMLLRRLNVGPGQHGAKGRRRISAYGQQLREKQKAKKKYGILERQFRRYFTNALKFRGNTGATLLTQLEKRLDNVVYRLSLAPTRVMARQLVSHGHVTVNDQKVSIPSYQVALNDVVTLKPKAVSIPAVKKILEEKNPVIPTWLVRQGVIGKIVRQPERTDVDADINEQLIVEYYSR